MGSKTRISLPENFITKLVKLPEQGMGYQLVDVKLKNGKVLKNKFVYNCSILELDENEFINKEDIISIQIHKM